MNNRKIALILLLIILLISSANAANIQFIDAGGIGKGQLTVFAPNNTQITALNSSELFEASNGTAYILDYQASGLTTVKEETGFNFAGLKFLISYYSDFENLGNICVLCLCLLLLLLGVMGKL
jgi:hypothetical protein